MGSTQLRFLEQALQESLERREWVLLFHHIPLHPHAAPHEALLWDYADVLGLLHRYPHVLATLSGAGHETTPPLSTLTQHMQPHHYY